MSVLNKLIEFGSSPKFRSAKLRQWAWPIVMRAYPNLAYIGIQPEGGQPTLLYAGDRFITTDFLKHGRNFTPLEASLGVLQGLGAPLGGVFFDIGSNIGTESIAALESGLFERAIAVELSPANVRLLRANLAIRGLESRVRVFANGAADQPGVATVKISAENCGDHKVGAGEGGEAVSVPLKTADQMIEEAGESIDSLSLLWIDVQGYEGFVLKGARKILSGAIPLVMEYSPRSLDEYGCHDDVISLIMSSYRHMYDLSEPQPSQRDVSDLPKIREGWSDRKEHTDFLFI